MTIVMRRAICMELPIAGLVIGYFGAFFGIIMFFLKIDFLHIYTMYLGSVAAFHPKFKLTSLVRTYIDRISICLDLLTSIFLIVGIQKKAHRMLLPWLISNGMRLFLGLSVVRLCFIFVLSAAAQGAHAMTSKQSENFVYCPLMLIFVGILIYTFFAVYSLYKLFRDELLQTRPQSDSEAQQAVEVCL